MVVLDQQSPDYHKQINPTKSESQIIWSYTKPDPGQA